MDGHELILNGKLEIIWIVALLSAAGWLAIDLGGGGIELVLGSAFSASVVVYVALKAMESKAMRFPERTQVVTLDSTLLGLGVLVVCADRLYSIYGQPSTFAFDLAVVGTVIVVSAVVGHVLILATASSSKVPVVN